MSGVLDDYYRLRIRNRADSADLLVITSVPSGTNPYIKEPPRGDGDGFDPMTNEQSIGSYTVLVVDSITSGTDRVVTSKLEDVNGQLQLGFLKTYIEVSRDGATWSSRTVGYLTVNRLVDAITWELTIQSALRTLANVQLFNPASTELITDFLAAWPRRGCLYGGPIIADPVAGNWLQVKDLGGWRMRVRHSDSGLGRSYWLDPVDVYGPADGLKSWEMTTIGELRVDTINTALQKIVATGKPSFGAVPFTTIADAMASRPWPGLVVLLDRIDGAGFAEVWRPIQPGYAGADDGAQSGADIVLVSKQWSGVGIIRDNQTALALNSLVRVRCLTVMPSEVSPIYFDGHPIDHLENFCALKGIGFSDALGTRDAMGSGLRVSLRMTKPLTLGELLRQTVFNLGVAVRSDSSGNIVPFLTCPKLSSSLPSKTITGSLVVDGSVHLPFEQDVGQAGLQTVVVRTKAQVIKANAADSVIEGDREFTLLNEDAQPLASGSLELDIPGMVRLSPKALEPVGLDYWQSFAKPRFARFGRANQRAELDLQRGDGTTDADTVYLGDEFLLDIPQLPNANKRLGDDVSVSPRAVQIIQQSEAPERRPVRLSDSGPNAQPLTTKPTHTIAASTDLPRTVAELTITNAATLNGLGYTARLQLAVVAHGASAPVDADYVDWLVFTQAAIPTTAIRVTAVVAGSDVYVRARSELQGRRPSAWQTAVHVSLSLVDDPTSVAAAAVIGDGSLLDVSWAIGANAGDDATDIYVRLSSESFAAARKVISLLPGSTQFRIHGLTPSTAYKVSVQHRDPGTQDVSDPVDASVTSDSAVAVLDPPTGALGFADGGAGDAVPILTGTYGLAVVATEFPSSVEFQEAIETDVASDSYGAYSTVAVLPSLASDFTVFSRIAPNDGLRRRLRARHTRDGTTASAWTVPVTVTPWTYDPLVLEEQAISLNNFKFEDSSDGLTRTYTMVCGSRVQRVVLFVSTADVPVTADTWPTAASVPTAILVPDPVTRIATYAFTLPAATQQSFLQFEPRLEDWSAGPLRRNVTDALPIIPVPQGTLEISGNGAWTWTIDGAATVDHLKYAESTTAFPSDATAAAGTTVAGPGPFLRSGGAALTFGQTEYVTAIAYNAAGVQVGPAIHLKGSYQTFSGSKTTVYGVGGWIVAPDSAQMTYTVDLTSGMIQNVTPLADGYNSLWDLFTTLPAGVTITGFSIDLYDSSTGHPTIHSIHGFIQRLDGTTATSIATWVNPSISGGAQTVSGVLSETTSATRSYRFRMQFDYDFIVRCPAGSLRFGNLYLTYTQPQPDKTV